MLPWFAQLLERFEAMKQAQPQRSKMLGIAWGKDHLEVWRLGGEEPDDRSCVRSNVLQFAWDADNSGYQVIVPFKLQCARHMQCMYSRLPQ